MVCVCVCVRVCVHACVRVCMDTHSFSFLSYTQARVLDIPTVFYLSHTHSHTHTHTLTHTDTHRLSIGIETVEDIINDLDRALNSLES